MTSGGLGTTVYNMDKFLQDSGSGSRIISNLHADAFLLIFADFFSFKNNISVKQLGSRQVAISRLFFKIM